MNAPDKFLMAVPAVVWLAGWGVLEAHTLIKARLRKQDTRCAPAICGGLPLCVIRNAAPMAEVWIPLLGKPQMVASTGLMDMAPCVQEAVFAHEMAHLACRHAGMVRWLVFVGMATATLGCAWVLSLSDDNWRCVMALFWFGQWCFLAPLFFLLERQADAGAAALLSGTSPTITTAAAKAVADAVIAVEAANSPWRAARHTRKMAGKRAARIRALAGQPCGATAPDRAVRWIWRISFVLLALDVAAMVWLILR